MKHEFITKDLGDKVLITHLVNGIKVASMFKMTGEDLFSHYVNVKEAENSMRIAYEMSNSEEIEEGA